MNVITISREYGAGGSEVGKRLAEALGWELLDRELLHQAAAVEHVPDADLERLDEKAISTADRFRLHPPHQQYIHGLTEAARQATARGNVILVGRGARQLLAETAGCFHLRLVAPRDWRVERMARLEKWTPEQALARCLEVDRTRERFNRYFFSPAALQSSQYDLVVNTGRVPLDEVVACVVLAVSRNDKQPASGSTGQRVLTLARELGAGDTGFAPTLADRLKLRVYDRELLEQEAIRLGVPESTLEKIRRVPRGHLSAFSARASLYQRYFEALGKIMNDLAAGGDVLLVGRGGSRFLREHPRAFHVRLVAPMAVRAATCYGAPLAPASAGPKADLRERCPAEPLLRGLLRPSWSDPLEYHVTVNTGRLGPLAVDLVAFAAERVVTR